MVVLGVLLGVAAGWLLWTDVGETTEEGGLRPGRAELAAV